MSSDTLASLLKIYTKVDSDFIDRFFSKFNIGDDLQFHILEDDVCDYLEINIQTLRRRLFT